MQRTSANDPLKPEASLDLAVVRPYAKEAPTARVTSEDSDRSGVDADE